MERNKELFNKIAEQIDSDPNSYDQHDWGEFAEESLCGTAHCIAGWAVMLAEDTAESPYEHRWLQNLGNRTYRLHSVPPKNKNIKVTFVVTRKTAPFEISASEYYDHIMEFEDVGGELLGISTDETNCMFDSAWKAAPHLSPSDALRKFSENGDLVEVTDESVAWLLPRDY